MKVYLSGKISGLPIADAIQKFAFASNQIRALRLVPVNPMEKSLPADACWKEHMVQDIALLFECQAIYLQADWKESKGARIEECIARETNMIILEQLPFFAWEKE